MREVIEISKDEIIPDQADALALQGICPGTKVSANILTLFDSAVEIFAKRARPVGIVGEISKNDFGLVYAGEGRNDASTPVAEISQRAAHLALFVTTVGQALHDNINELFVGKDFALGSMLDSVASVGVEKAADVLETYFRDGLLRDFGVDRNITVMRYSPGYCGWHVSGQRKLFDYLKPEEVGITLRSSYLMEPLKSASGVFIAGAPEIHIFADAYACCSQCESHSCRERISSIVDTSSAPDTAGSLHRRNRNRKE